MLSVLKKVRAPELGEEGAAPASWEDLQSSAENKVGSQGFERRFVFAYRMEA